MTPRALLAIVALSGFAATAQPIDPCKLPILKSVLPQCKKVTAPFFVFAPASGVGIGTACLCAPITGTKGETVTDQRATDGWCINKNFVYTKCPVGAPRVMPGRVDETWLGIASESQRQNLLVNGTTRDLSSASWTKSNMTCTKTATGVDSVANHASTCTASASNATVKQCVTLSSSSVSVSIHVRRNTGAGTVGVSIDGSTFSDITSGVTSSWNRAVPSESIGCAGGRCVDVAALQATVANPCIAVRLGTNGDAVDLDLAQVEVGGYASTPIEVDGVNMGFRLQDLPFATIAFATDAGFSYSTTLVTEMNLATNVTAELAINGSNAASSYPVDGETLQCNYISSGAGPTAGVNTGTTTFLKIPTAYSCQWNGVDTVTANLATASGSAIQAAPGFTATKFYLGGSGATSTSADVVIRAICLDPSQSRCASTSVPSHATHSLGYSGDSIAAGEQVSYEPVVYIRQLLGTDWAVIDSAVGGSTTGDVLSRWTSTVRAQHPGVVTVMVGVNDAISLIPNATSWSNLQTLLNQARSDGAKVVPQYVLNCDGGLNCGTGAQGLVANLNSNISDWCSDAGATCLDMRPVFQSSGTMLPQYDNGDHIHLNVAGSQILTQAIHDAVVAQ